jgi:hypothetical protein
MVSLLFYQQSVSSNLLYLLGAPGGADGNGATLFLVQPPRGLGGVVWWPNTFAWSSFWRRPHPGEWKGVGSAEFSRRGNHNSRGS